MSEYVSSIMNIANILSPANIYKYFENKNDIDDSVKQREIISTAVFKSLHFTSKFVTICELTGKEYKDDKIKAFRLDGAAIINPHHCYGIICYHPSNRKYIQDANNIYQYENNIILYHNFTDINVKFSRSNGKIYDGYIKENTPITYWDDTDTLYIKVFFKDGNNEYEKSIPFIDSAEYSGLYSLNPDIFNDFILHVKMKHGTGLFDDNIEEWKSKMSQLLDYIGIKYTFSINI